MQAKWICSNVTAPNGQPPCCPSLILIYWFFMVLCIALRSGERNGMRKDQSFCYNGKAFSGEGSWFVTDVCYGSNLTLMGPQDLLCHWWVAPKEGSTRDHKTEQLLWKWPHWLDQISAIHSRQSLWPAEPPRSNEHASRSSLKRLVHLGVPRLQWTGRQGSSPDLGPWLSARPGPPLFAEPLSWQWSLLIGPSLFSATLATPLNHINLSLYIYVMFHTQKILCCFSN